MREPVTKVFRRAGCGKSARPVRRGDGKSRINPLLPVLLYRLNKCLWFYSSPVDLISIGYRGLSQRVTPKNQKALLAAD